MAVNTRIRRVGMIGIDDISGTNGFACTIVEGIWGEWLDANTNSPTKSNVQSGTMVWCFVRFAYLSVCEEVPSKSYTMLRHPYWRHRSQDWPPLG